MGGGGELSEDPVAAGTTVFTLTFLDDKYATVLLVFFILFTMGLERLLEFVEHIIKKKEPAYVAMLAKLYKELMILGLLSFFLILVLATTSLYTDYILIFEFVHLWIFFVALLFVAHAFVFMWEASGFARGWYQTSYVSMADVRKRYHVEFHSGTWKLSHMIKNRFDLVFGHVPVVGMMEFHHLRVWFLKRNQLPRNFDFPLYLQLCLSEFVSAHLDAKDSSWIILMILLCANVGITIVVNGDTLTEQKWTYYSPDPNANLNNILQWTVVGWILCFLSFFLATEARRIKRKLLAKTGIKTSDLDSMDKALEEDEQTDLQIPYYLPNQIYKESVGWGVEQDSDDVDIDDAERGPVSGHSGGHGHNIFQSLGTHESRDNGVMNEEVRTLFRFGRPGLYVGFFDLMMLLQCFYLGYFFLRNIMQAYYLWEDNIVYYVLWIIAALAPQLVVMLRFAPSIIKNFVLVASLAHINLPVMYQVKQNMDEMHILANELGEKLKQNLRQKMGLEHFDTPELVQKAEEELLQMFKQLDKNRDGQIQLEVDMFRKSLRKFKLRVTKKQAEKIIRVLDIDRSGGVNLQEFTDFVFGKLGNEKTMEAVKKGKNSSFPETKQQPHLQTDSMDESTLTPS